jgi:hypothetical protein
MAKSVSRKGWPPRGKSRLLLAAAAVVVVVVVLLLVNTRGAQARHPGPRADVAQVHTLEPGHFQGHPGIAVTYDRAGKIKQILDGLSCYCFCRDHSGHYSLLDCFRDEHGAGCDICLEEANLAFELSERGATLKDIRAAIDRQFGR